MIEAFHPLIIVGLTGATGAGKDTFAQLLINDFRTRNWGLQRVALADPLRSLLLATNLDVQTAYIGHKQIPPNTPVFENFDAPYWHDQATWRVLKDDHRLEIVHRLVTLGQSARKYVREDIWFSAAERKIRVGAEAGCATVVTDMRNHHEYWGFCHLAVNAHFYPVRIRRPGVAEQGIDGLLREYVCTEIINCGPPEHMLEQWAAAKRIPYGRYGEPWPMPLTESGREIEKLKKSFEVQVAAERLRTGDF